MFLSKLVLNLRHPKVRCDLARPYEMHRSLMKGYPYPRVEKSLRPSLPRRNVKERAPGAAGANAGGAQLVLVAGGLHPQQS